MLCATGSGQQLHAQTPRARGVKVLRDVELLMLGDQDNRSFVTVHAGCDGGHHAAMLLKAATNAA